MGPGNRPWYESWRESNPFKGNAGRWGQYGDRLLRSASSRGIESENGVLTEVEEVLHDNPDANPRAALGALLFSGNERVQEDFRSLGWRKEPVALAKLLMKPCNFLIMDEPTNHLDIRSKEVLQEALNLFDGAAIIVSHDRFFLDGVVTKVLEVSRQDPDAYLQRHRVHGTPRYRRGLKSDPIG